MYEVYGGVQKDEIRLIIDGKKIGIGHDCHEFLEATLKEVDKEIEVVDAEPLFFELRACKDEVEIAKTLDCGLGVVRLVLGLYHET